MFKTRFILLFGCLIIASCGSQYEKALRSTDEEFIFKVAQNEFNKEKYSRALTVYEYGAPYFAASDSAEVVAYNTAYSNFKTKNYSVSGRQFKNFYDAYPKSKKREDALYFAGYSYYLASPSYNLDQTNTLRASDELQFFLEKYPNSSNSDKVNAYIQDLRNKLEKKYYSISLDYYKIYQYRAAIISFSNFLDDYPDTIYKEDAYLYLMRSRFELAVRSVEEKKKGRIKEGIYEAENFIGKFSDSKYLDEAKKLLEKLQIELQDLELKNKS